MRRPFFDLAVVIGGIIIARENRHVRREPVQLGEIGLPASGFLNSVDELAQSDAWESNPFGPAEEALGRRIACEQVNDNARI